MGNDQGGRADGGASGLLDRLSGGPPWDGALLTDASGLTVAADEGAAALTGQPPAALVGRRLAELLDPAAAPALPPPTPGRLDPRWAPARLRRSDGSLAEVELGGLALPGGQVLWTLRDARRRRGAAEALHSRLQALESSINGIALAGLDGNLTYVNRAFLRMWGYAEPAEVLGRPAPSFWESTEAAAGAMAGVMNHGGWVGELIGRRKGGESFVVQLAASLVVGEGGQPRAMLASFLDVTGRSRAAEALARSEERLQLALRVASLGTYDHDHRTGVTAWSEEERRIYGVSPDQEGSLPAYLDFVHPEDLPRVREAVERATTPGGDGVFDIEHRIRRSDGAIRWVKARSLTTFEGEGPAARPVRTVGVVLDITDSRKAEAERERLQAQLNHAQRMESVGRLAGGVAHDFNNMLGVILGNAELLRARLPPATEEAEDLSEIEQAARRARDLTRQLLAFSRKQVIAPRPLSLNEALEQTQRTLARLLGEDVEVRVFPGPDLWLVDLDPSQLDQILMNLAVNARDAMPHGGKLTLETVNVRLDEASCRERPGLQPGDYVLLAVSDTGVGMEPDVQAHLFEPFFTTKPQGQGTGLGLATVYGIVTQNQGMVHVYSEPGQGSTFKVYLRRSRATAAEAPAAEAPAVELAGLVVLVVEDEPMVRRVTCAMLGSLGAVALAPASPQEALALAADPSRPLDVLLTDVVMPGMSGKALRDRVLRLRPGLPVVFMSGYTPNVIVHHGVLEEGVYLLQKPFSLGGLSAELGRALRRS